MRSQCLACQRDGEDLILRVRVQTRASKDEFAEKMPDRYRVRITAAPVDGKANKHLLRFVAKTFAVPPNHVKLINGQTSRNKTLRIQMPCRLPDWLKLDSVSHNQ